MDHLSERYLPLSVFRVLILFLFIALFNSCHRDIGIDKENSGLNRNEPSDWFNVQRSFPGTSLDMPAYKKALNSVNFSSRALRIVSSGWNGDWMEEGPANIGGRINCVAIHPLNPNIIYAGNSTGGIFKTIDGGNSWFPVFDDQPWLAISCIVFQPGNPNIIYAGTGDKNISGYPFIGDGIYKSVDAGITWTHLGLTDEHIISKIVIDPTNVNIIYAATMGIPFYKNNNRGVYRSINGGVTWTQSLFVNDSTGAIDLLMNPQNPQILYAATWNRIRNYFQTLVAGPDAGIYKTDDGGITWNKLTNGLPTADISRIGLAMSGTNPDVLWAVYTDNTIDLQGIYKTANGGLSWNAIGNPGNSIMGGFGWYFGRIEVNQSDDNELWLCAVDMWHTIDGGANWTSAWQTSDPHADKHDIQNQFANIWIMATDGGLYKTTDNGITWNDIDMIANNQFYRITYNPHNPGEYAGGVQDNGTNVGNANVMTNWQQLFGADGFQIRYHPTNPNINYVEIQNGDIFVTTDNGVTYNGATNGIDPFDRRSWDMPYILNVNNPNELYTGTYRVYKNSTGTNANWSAISPDLTDGIAFGARFHFISAIDQSSVNNNDLLAGTSDGNVWISLNGGNNWSNVSTALPDRYVTSVHFSPNTQNLAYVAHSGYKSGEFIPHIHKTNNNGLTWTDISSNLPQLAINDLQTYPGNDSILFVATDGGVYGTIDAGQNWNRIGNNMPVIPVYDIDRDPFSNKLLAGTFARSMWSYPIDSILISGLNENYIDVNFSLYPNPATDDLFIRTERTGFYPKQVYIYNVKGELVKEISNGDEGKRISVKDLATGSYFLKMKDGMMQGVGRFVKF